MSSRNYATDDREKAREWYRNLRKPAGGLSFILPTEARARVLAVVDAARLRPWDAARAIAREEGRAL